MVIILETEMGGTCGTHGRNEKKYEILVQKFEIRRPVSMYRRRWGNIKIDLMETGCEWMECIQLAL
jgi:hypothetical protein